jgi:hypothetical protein
VAKRSNRVTDVTFNHVRTEVELEKMEDDSDSSFAPSSSPSTSVSSSSLTDTRLSDIPAADGSAATSSSATVAAAVSIAPTSSTSQSTPSRKRKRSVENWEASKRKLLRNSGKEYVTASKKNVSFCLRS